MADFIKGLGFGLILQISVGPVCLAVLHQGITRGFRQAFAMVWGVSLVDAFYIGLSVAGVSTLLQVSAVRSAVGLVGAVVLAAFGLRYLLTPAVAGSEPLRQATPGGEGAPLRASFLLGAGLTLTNPLTILFWAGVLGAMLASRQVGTPPGAGAIDLSMLSFSAGCVAATLLFLTAVALAGHLLERLLTPRLMVWLNRLVGLFLIGFALRLGLDALG